MVTPTRIARGLGILGVIAFMAMATGSSIATSNLQDDPAAALAPALPAGLDELPDAAPAPTEPEPLKDLPPAPDEPALKLDIPPAPTPEPAPLPTAAPAPIDEPAANPLPPARERVPTAAPEPAPAPAARPRPSADDPDAKARSFVERNRKEADEQLKALREEAAQLKARLGRVEAGIRRWESLADALDRSSEDRAAMRTPSEVQGRPAVQQYIVPGRAPIVIHSQPVTRSDYVPAPLPR